MGVGQEADAVLSDAWKARVSQLIHWAVGEEKEDGDIHFGLSCYCEAIFLVHRAVTRVGADGKPAASPALLAAIKPTLQAWIDRALLLQSIIAEESIPPSNHPLLRPLPGPPVPGHVAPSPQVAQVEQAPPPAEASSTAAADLLDFPLPPGGVGDEGTKEVGGVAPAEDDYRSIFGKFLEQQEKGGDGGSSTGVSFMPPPS
eukprot:Hpha_TRINITY_DN14459_c0_g1::TRINITY_DN14459_c0_g1_i2::g.158054::m.158054